MKGGEKQCVLQDSCIPLGLWSELDFSSVLGGFPKQTTFNLTDFIPQEFSTLNRSLRKCEFRISPKAAVQRLWICVLLEQWLFLSSIRKTVVFKSTMSDKLIANIWSPLTYLNFQDSNSKLILALSRCVYSSASIYTTSLGELIRKWV